MSDYQNLLIIDGDGKKDVQEVNQTIKSLIEPIIKKKQNLESEIVVC